jgi:lipopolysaccharide/colanic/teichoic acid biosynthesis glycosyltransferase
VQIAVDQTTELTSAGEDHLGFPVHPWWSYPATLKRVLDISVAVVFLLCSLPVWLLIAVAIKVDSPGPVFFVQERVGLRGRRFRFYKFRSMRVGADRARAEVQHLNEVSGPVFKVRRDPRITRVGRLLRRTSLDELPQLANVIRGEMSIVGPRPPLPEEVAQYRASDMVRLGVKPGLTCWWQVRGRSNCDFDTWMAYDREYVYGLSLWVDLVIVIRTTWAVLSCRGAY